MNRSAKTILSRSLIILITFSSCSKKEIPILTTETVSAITIMSAKSGGNIQESVI